MSFFNKNKKKLKPSWDISGKEGKNIYSLLFNFPIVLIFFIFIISLISFAGCGSGLDGLLDNYGNIVLDNDSDGVLNNIDNCPDLANDDQSDMEGDGVGDPCDNCPLDSNPGQENNDGDGQGDACDDDDDNDGVLDSAPDNCPFISNPGQENNYGGSDGDACEDTDSDGVMDDADNCPLVPNPGQADSNSDTEGDACDTNDDSDSDGWVDASDCAPLDDEINPGAEDVCNDGVDNNCDGEADDGCFDTDINSFSLADQREGAYIDSTNHEIIIYVVNGTNVSSLVPAIGIPAKSDISPTGVTDFTLPVEYTITPGDSSTSPQVWTVYVRENDEKEITSFRFLNGENGALSVTVDGIISDNIITARVPSGTVITSLVPDISITGVDVSPGDGIAHDFTNTVTYTVIADDGTTRDYFIMVNIAENDERAITSFVFYASENPFSQDIVCEINGTSIYASVPDDITDVQLQSLIPRISIIGSSVTPGDGVINDFSSAASYTVTASSGNTLDTTEYTVTLNNAPGNVIGGETSSYYINPSTSNPGNRTSLGVNGSNIYVAYYNSSSSRLMMVKSTNGGTSWDAPIEVDNDGTVGQYNSIAVVPDRNGDGDDIYIAYYEDGSSYGSSKIARSTDGGTTWTTGYIREGTNILLSITDFGMWSDIEVIPGAGPSSDNIYVTYVSNTRTFIAFANAGIDIAISTNGGASFNTSYSIVASGGLLAVEDGEYKSMAAVPDRNADGNDIYVTVSAENMLYQYKSTNGGTVFTTARTVYGSQGAFTSTGVSPHGSDPAQDTVYVGYYDDSGGDNLAFADSSDGGVNWSDIDIDSPGQVGQYTSMHVADISTVFISYYDATNGDLKFARTTDGGNNWDVQLLDPSDDSGRVTSMAVDGSNIYISYTRNGYLALAKSTDGGNTWVEW